jgi:tetratricopeptide (TPR) repeat protein
MTARLGLGTVYACRGHVERAIPLLERSMSLAQEGNFQVSNSASALGAALTLAGRAKAAVPILQRSVDESAANGRMSNRSLYLLRLGRALLGAGRLHQAEEVAARAFDTARTYGERGHEAWILYLCGEIAGSGDSRGIAAAAARYHEAMALGQRLGMRPLVARCHARLGALHRLTGERDRAGHHLSESTAMLQEMGMRFGPAEVDAEAT